MQHLVGDLNTFVTPGLPIGYNKSMIYLFIHFIVLSRANKGITNDVYFPRCELYTGVEEVPQLCFIPHAAVQFSREEVLPYGFEIVVVFLYPSLTFFPFPSSRQGETKMFPKLAGASEVSQTLSLISSPLVAPSLVDV